MMISIPTPTEDYLKSLPMIIRALVVRLNNAQIKASRGDGDAIIEMAAARRALIEACQRHGIDHKTICL